MNLWDKNVSNKLSPQYSIVKVWSVNIKSGFTFRNIWSFELKVMAQKKAMSQIHDLIHYYKMWVQFSNPYSPNQWIHCFFTGPHSLQPVNSFKIQWNCLVYKDTFCYSVYWPLKPRNMDQITFDWGVQHGIGKILLKITTL